MNVFIEDTKSWRTLIHSPLYYDESTPSAEELIRNMGAMYPNGEFRERDKEGDFNCSDTETFERYAFDLEAYDNISYLIDRIKSETDYPLSYIHSIIENAQKIVEESTEEILPSGLLWQKMQSIVAHEFGYLDE